MWIPFAIQGGEALIMALAAIFAAHAAGADWQTSIIAGIAGATGKVLPKQILPGGK